MAVQTIDRMIGTVSYKVTQFPARTGLKLKTELIKLLAPSLMSVSGLDKNIENINIGNIIGALCDKLDEDHVENLVLRLLACTRREGKEVVPIFDDVYAGNYGELFNALKLVIEVNFASFFQQLGIGNLKENIQEVTKTKSKG